MYQSVLDRHRIYLSFYTWTSGTARLFHSIMGEVTESVVGVLNLHLLLFNGPIPSVCIPLFDSHRFPLIDYLEYRAQPSTPLMSEKRPLTQGAVPPNYRPATSYSCGSQSPPPVDESPKGEL